jgi:hypothetical protein
MTATATLSKMVSLAASSLLFSAVAHAAEAPAYVRVRSLSFAGSGCPANTVAQNVAPDLKAFTLRFDSYIAQIGPGVPFTEKRKNCQVNVDLEYPTSWTYTVMTLEFRGNVRLQSGVNGLSQSTYYFGTSSVGRLKNPMSGPLDEDYRRTDSVDLTSAPWSPCGALRALNINTELRVENLQNPQGFGQLTTDSIDGFLRMTYGMRWKRC